MVNTRAAKILTASLLALAPGLPARADVVAFFDPAQSLVLDTSGATSDRYTTEGFTFTCTRDKLFNGGGGGPPTGRFLSVDWPDGVQAQAVTVGPTGPAKVIVRRVDADTFDLPAFTLKLLANTFGAGGAVEVMPQLAGEDLLADPVPFDVSGSAGVSFSFGPTPNIRNESTALLKDADTYVFSLYVDYALTAVTVNGAPVPEPAATALGGAAAVVVAAALTRRRARRTP
ncbi:MAG: hypothetical protein ACAI43_23750 [Phycisphaerae bacterium]